eukprot:8753544-Karenia_brevis.AAC.1
MCPALDAEEVHDVPGTGLPPAKRSRRAADIQRWCLAGSWSMCSACKVLQAQDMVPSNFDRLPSPYMSPKQCW